LSRPGDRTAHLQRLVLELMERGPRPVMEAFLQAAAARPDQLIQILESYVAIPAEIYHAIGADVLEVTQPLRVVAGGKR
jgi:hypothetical protein